MKKIILGALSSAFVLSSAFGANESVREEIKGFMASLEKIDQSLSAWQEKQTELEADRIKCYQELQGKEISPDVERLAQVINQGLTERKGMLEGYSVIATNLKPKAVKIATLLDHEQKIADSQALADKVEALSAAMTEVISYIVLNQMQEIQPILEATKQAPTEIEKREEASAAYLAILKAIIAQEIAKKGVQAEQQGESSGTSDMPELVSDDKGKEAAE